MKIRFYLKRPKAKKETIVFALVNYNGNSLKIYTTESIHPKNWNKKKNVANAGLSEQGEFNMRLDKIRSDINRVFMDYQNKNDNACPSPALLKPMVEKALKKGIVNTTFLDYFNDFTKRTLAGHRLDPKSKRSVRPTVGKGYNTTYNHLVEFNKQWKKKLDFDTVNLEFHNAYTEYLTSDVKLSANTIGDHFKRIKAVMAEASEHGVTSNNGFKSKYFIKQREEAETIYLNEKELKAIQDHDLTGNERLQNVRDLFLIGCHTALRISDLSALAPDKIRDGYIRLKQKKTGKQVTIPVHPVVQKILDKYKGNTPRQISDQKMNKYLKELGELMPILKQPVSITSTKGGQQVTTTNPKYKFLTSHCMRRSFATNEYWKGNLTMLEIMAITGHESEAVFLRYIRVTKEEHAQSVKAKWEKEYKAKKKAAA